MNVCGCMHIFVCMYIHICKQIYIYVYICVCLYIINNTELTIWSELSQINFPYYIFPFLSEIFTCLPKTKHKKLSETKN